MTSNQDFDSMCLHLIGLFASGPMPLLGINLELFLATQMPLLATWMILFTARMSLLIVSFSLLSLRSKAQMECGPFARRALNAHGSIGQTHAFP